MSGPSATGGADLTPTWTGPTPRMTYQRGSKICRSKKSRGTLSCQEQRLKSKKIIISPHFAIAHQRKPQPRPGTAGGALVSKLPFWRRSALSRIFRAASVGIADVGFWGRSGNLCSTRALLVLTPTGHERAAFAAMHGPDLLYLAWSLGLGVSAMKRCMQTIGL